MSDDSGTSSRPRAKRAAARPGPATPQRICDGCAFISTNPRRMKRTDSIHSTERTQGFGKFGQDTGVENVSICCGVKLMALSAGKRKLALPLPALLSQVLVAFTIEFDNEFERRSPHRTTVAGKKSSAQSSPWLTSMVMWANLIRLVPEDGITVGELRKHSRAVKLSLAGMERWGYI